MSIENLVFNTCFEPGIIIGKHTGACYFCKNATSTETVGIHACLACIRRITIHKNNEIHSYMFEAIAVSWEEDDGKTMHHNNWRYVDRRSW